MAHNTQRVDKDTFKQIFRDHWGPFQQRHPRYQDRHVHAVIDKMLGCGTRSCTPTLRTIPLAQKPGKMPPSHYALEGARPWSRLFFTTNSPYACSCGSSSCCLSL